MPIAAQLLPAAAKFLRQIVPPVVATLIAAVLIAAYNKTFSSHLSQPRFSGLQAEASATLPAAPAVAKTAEPATEVITINEFVDEPERLADKDAGQESGKGQSAIKVAAEPAAPRTTPAPRAEPRRVAALEQPPPTSAPIIAPPPVIVAVPVAPVAAAPVAQEPPPVIVATPPMVTVPDRSSARPTEEAHAPPPASQGALGRIVNTLKPSNWFARAREFGERIEQAGNDILPNIRQ
jgi:hypothetical protein